MPVPTLAIALCMTVVLGGCLADTDTEIEVKVSTFEECEAANYTISESQPRTCTTPSGDVYVESQRSEGGDVKIQMPQENMEVSSELTIKGEALGSWFSEGVFPVVITDTSGNVLFRTFARAQGDWMTEGFVPFEVTFATPVAKRTDALVILQKDHPPGLPSNAVEVRIPVTLLPSA